MVFKTPSSMLPRGGVGVYEGPDEMNVCKTREGGQRPRGEKMEGIQTNLVNEFRVFVLLKTAARSEPNYG